MLTQMSSMVSKNTLRLQSSEVSVRRSKADRVCADIIGFLTFSNYLDEDAVEKRLERLARLEKENKKMKVKLLKASKEAAKSTFISNRLGNHCHIFLGNAALEDSDDNSIESEDLPEVDQPVRFSSSVRSSH